MLIFAVEFYCLRQMMAVVSGLVYASKMSFPNYFGILHFLILTLAMTATGTELYV